MKKVIAVIGTLLVSAGGASAERAFERFAITNVQTGKNIRPFKAKKTDGNAIILYNDWRWQCMTWDLLPVGDDRYQLRNRYTGKTLVPSTEVTAGVSLWQQPMSDLVSPEWQFIKQDDGTYLIKQGDGDFYITISSHRTNSPIILMPLDGSDTQKWRLRKQDPWI